MSGEREESVTIVTTTADGVILVEAGIAPLHMREERFDGVTHRA
jgi:hypothetical protein